MVAEPALDGLGSDGTFDGPDEESLLASALVALSASGTRAGAAAGVVAGAAAGAVAGAVAVCSAIVGVGDGGGA